MRHYFNDVKVPKNSQEQCEFECKVNMFVKNSFHTDKTMESRKSDRSSGDYGIMRNEKNLRASSKHHGAHSVWPVTQHV